MLKDLNGYTEQDFLEKVKEKFTVEESAVQVHPDKQGTFGMYLGKKWYRLTAKPEILSDDPVDGLDVSVLQNALLSPVLGIKDPNYTIYNLLTKQKENGVAVVFVGEDLDVLVELCDRIMVINSGKITGMLDGRNATKEEIGLLMTKTERKDS